MKAPKLARLRLGEDVFTTGQVAALTGVASRTVSMWCDGGLLPHFRIPGSKTRRIYRTDLITFAQKRGLRLRFRGRAVAVLAPGVPADYVTPLQLGGMVARAEVSAVLLGCEDGLGAAVRLARELRREAPAVRLTLLRPDDVPLTAVPTGVFDNIVSSAQEAA